MYHVKLEDKTSEDNFIFPLSLNIIYNNSEHNLFCPLFIKVSYEK